MDTKIPKVIHYCWVGEKEIPDKDKKNIETWKKMCPDYKFMFWNEENYDFTKNQYMQEAYEKKKWGFVPDYLRLDVIYQYGGIYLDTDVEIIKKFDSLLEEQAFAGFEGKENVAFGLGFGAVPHNPIIKEMKDYYEKLKFINDDGTLNLTPSPIYQTEILKKHNLVCNGKYQKLDSITVYPQEFFSPMDYLTGKLKITDKTMSIHWYNASWHTEEEEKYQKKVRKINRIFGKRIGAKICQIMNAFVIIKESGLKGVYLRLKEKKKKKNV